MTISELLDEELALGFTNTLDMNSVFIKTVNRAIREMYNDYPNLKRLKILKDKAEPVQTVKMIKYTALKEVAVEILGKSVIFKLSGKGNYRINESGEKISFDTRYAVVKMHLNPHDLLIFSGDTPYTVYDLNAFEEKLPLDTLCAERLIPYDMKALTDDFLSFNGAPRDENGNEILSAVCYGSTISIPREINGEIEINYKARPTPITLDDSDKEIDAPEECLPLLPLLVAGYLWLDDEPEKAQYYTALYHSGIEKLKKQRAYTTKSSYNDVLGWA